MQSNNDNIESKSNDNIESEALRQMNKFPTRIPVKVKKSSTSKLTPPKEFKYKFLVEKNDTLSAFLYALRKRLNLNPEEALFLFTENNTLLTNGKIETLYEKHKNNEDMFLHITFSEENTFGCDI